MTTTYADVLMPPRLLAPGGAPADSTTHEQRYGPVSYGDPAQLLRAVGESGLTGRGGAAFATYRKLVSVADAGGRTGRAPVVVANGAEGEPASRKDKTLLHLSPHLVLDGLQLAAEAVSAGEAYLAVEAGASHLAAALTERRRDPLPVKVVRVPRRFLSGQSSALASYVSGGAALPQYQRPPVRERGVRRAPTLVQNVETLAHLALIARYGADWFRAAGTPSEPGSALCTVHVPGREGRVVEAPFGMPIGRLLPLGPTGAVLVGGYHGTWIPAPEAARLPLSNVHLGAGVLAVLSADHCGLAETGRVLRYLALQSAGQCGPCRNGLPRIAAAFRTLAAPGPQGTVRADVARWAGLVEGRGACHHPDGTVRLVRSALTTFATELDAHATGYCTATDRTPLLPVPDESS
ncbi:NADH-ubiquinone oxidoreductase-F iron-sulfur binding region domain-containing protein [Streptomyces turgidiscabies]|uniref:Respiratory-chain NADH dehydrogenase 51 Kd subunit n=1 Tax=Streptomyces turgidiscabies (strain Car8) TaxID=698760 RepID=L7FEE6_STRT8|nr:MULTISPECIES: NADH-ubiquinone oxidoreductase-F iron-sulfur binding region domain-containing protein [Streptomyces]ELP69471.1 respiratory-chain NADH dehydrogenase 51 Kd subunit [Streptomyces turgidiscabies Car8]MDX3496978.1 NADH-ubiquinone oxidoreductase-F iron-sulfur binding region domain-containing protein [Streptomyces turgidiscabies]GAQ76296.1 NADH-quinone oxidoreductase subunit 1 [Streptomyces turgidiscabies]